MMRTLIPMLAMFSGCASQTAPLASGTSVLQVSYVTGAGQVALGGQLTTLETAFEPCDAATISGGPVDYLFDGDQAVAEVDVPEAELCGIRIVATELIIEAEDGGVVKTIIGQDFDLVVPGDATPADGSALVLQLGDDTWLSEILPMAGEGTTHLNSEADPALVAAFFDGLTRGSTFTAEVADGEDTPAP